ncbi:MAG: preprotein translocase subunit SecG [Patescibacteria group bacterium]|nr:preprotein translocase subunit SecG [Patescibacteria group bacterium]
MNILNGIQLVSAVLLIAAILLQNRGTGLGAAFGGEGNIYRTKRGLEKTLFKATVVLAVIFLGAALANTLVRPPTASTVVPTVTPFESQPESNVSPEPSGSPAPAPSPDTSASPQTSATPKR